MNDLNWILSKEDSFRYQMLSRMQMDCDYYLGNGQIYGNHLWAGTEEEQIICMKAIWNSFPVDCKPEWLTYEQILEYDQKLKEIMEKKKISKQD